MLPGFSGSLVSEYFAEDLLPSAFAGRLGESSMERTRQELARWRREAAATLGPATGLRTMLDLGAAPVAGLLGFTVRRHRLTGREDALVAALGGAGTSGITFLISPWGSSLDRVWRQAVRESVHAGSAWCLCFNGIALRLVDTRRPYGRRFVQFDLAAAAACPRTFAVLWGLLRAEAFAPALERAGRRPGDSAGLGREPAGPASLLDQVVAESARHAAAVSASLRHGVLEALDELVNGLLAAAPHGHRNLPSGRLLADVFEQGLTIVYRILFLLFAEARGLVPIWHPLYRRSYSLESLRAAIERSARPRGLWESLQAISRLVHAGCRAGDLEVSPFNGRLFAPDRTMLAETSLVNDETVRRMLIALTTQPASGGRARIAYRDLGIEQLGAIYETVLDYRPAPARPVRDEPTGGRPTWRRPDAAPVRRVTLEPGGGRRKATGTFYTPQPLTDFLVRRTLHPLVDQASAESVLRLRVLDPAMGSGAFLVSACRYLASAYETALVREGVLHPPEITETDRAGFRRLVAQRCLFGVDLNPMAVQLGRLSLWLATLAAGRPLTFLDHHLAVGDSLIGASPADLARRPPPGTTRAARRRSERTTPLFDADDLAEGVTSVMPARIMLATRPDDTAAAVHEKEATLARLARADAPLEQWRTAADLWCACWFWDDHDPPGGAVFLDLADAVLRGRSALPGTLVATLLSRARAIAGARRFLHWPLAFPEVFYDEHGRPRADAGFDAVLGNPPWDMVRADPGTSSRAGGPRVEVDRFVRYVRESGLYPACREGHPNRFQLFVERGLRLLRHGGRIGLVVPSGLATDRGCAGLRRLLIDRADTDTLVGFENAEAVFPIHRSVRFLALAATSGGKTAGIRCRFGVRDPGLLDELPDASSSSGPPHFPVTLTPAFLRRVSGDEVAIPALRSAEDLSILEKVSASIPPFGSDGGWAAEFGRELNATDDRAHFHEGDDGLPVLEGKHVAPFVVSVGDSRLRIARAAAARLLDPGRTFDRPRLAYRDVASATNRLTLIAAVVPAGCVTTHTLFCLKTPLRDHEQWFLCGVLNSYVANFLVRQQVTTHLGTRVATRLAVPRPPPSSPEAAAIAELAVWLSLSPAPEAEPMHARLQALVAHLYGLTAVELAHVLDTFPLVPEARRREVARAFEELAGRGPSLNRGSRR